MPKILIELEIDYELIIQHYKWLMDLHEAHWDGVTIDDPPDLLALERMLESMIEEVFDDTGIYGAHREKNSRLYLVVLPDGSEVQIQVSGCAVVAIDSPSASWAELESGWVPILHGVATEEVSILDVEPELRVMIRQCISDGGMLESDQT